MIHEKYERNLVFRGFISGPQMEHIYPPAYFEKDSDYPDYQILHEITRLRLENVLSWLLDTKTFDTNSQNYEGDAPLHIAATSGQDVLTKLLLQQ